MRRSCHFGVLTSDDEARGGSPEPRKGALTPLARPDEGKIVIAFPKKTVLSRL
jgi:hypothetical protein